MTRPHSLRTLHAIADDPLPSRCRGACLLSRLRAATAAAIVAVAGLLASPPADAAPPAFAPGRILVEAKAGVTDAQFIAALAANGGRSLGKLRGLHTHVVSVPSQAEERIAARLANHPHVKFAELDRLATPGATTNDPLLGSQWHLPKVNAPTAWDTSTGTGTVIAILDTGIDGTHPDLASKLVPGWNFYGNNSDTSDPHGHGTAVAGAAAAAGNNATGVASVAWGAKLMPVRIADANAYAYWSTVAQGLTWAADNGARVANISYVGVAASSTVQSAANYMRGKGGVVVVCAGNNGIDEGIAPTDAMIVVSATDASDVKTSWSSWGSFVDLAAPGLSIYTTNLGGGYAYWSGTSLASPIVAGAAAMVKALRPTFTAQQIESALFSSAVDLGTAGTDTLYGYGRVNAAAALAAATATSVADTTPPTVAIASPSGGSTLTGTATVTVNASDNVGVARVDLLLNGKLLGSATAAPYTFAWDTTTMANGAATLSAVAVDAAGNSAASSPVSVTLSNLSQNVGADTTPPVVTILSPGNGSKIGNSVSISASASDAGGVAWMELAIDGSVVTSTTASSLSYKWNTRRVSNGVHTITVTGRDKAGNSASQTISVTK